MLIFNTKGASDFTTFFQQFFNSRIPTPLNHLVQVRCTLMSMFLLQTRD